MGNVPTKVNLQVPLKEMAKLPPHSREIKKALGFEDELDDPPIILQNMHFNKKNGGHEPFLLSQEINNLILHNCMLDLGAANVMPLKFMHQLETDITRP